MEDPLNLKVFNSLNDLLDYFESFLLAEQIPPVFVVFAHVCHEATATAILSDNVTMSLTFIYIVAFDNIGVIQSLDDLYLIFKQLQRRQTRLVERNDFYRVYLVGALFVRRLATISFVYTAAEPLADLVVLAIVIVPDLFLLLCFVCVQADCAWDVQR